MLNRTWSVVLVYSFVCVLQVPAVISFFLPFAVSITKWGTARDGAWFMLALFPFTAIIMSGSIQYWHSLLLLLIYWLYVVFVSRNDILSEWVETSIESSNFAPYFGQMTCRKIVTSRIFSYGMSSVTRSGSGRPQTCGRSGYVSAGA